jgi:hypothetical protein
MNPMVTNILFGYCLIVWVLTAYRVYQDIPDLWQKILDDLPPMLPSQEAFAQLVVVLLLGGIILISPLLVPFEIFSRIVVLKRRLKSRYHLWRLKKTVSSIKDKSGDDLQKSLERLAVSIEDHFDNMT